MRVSSVDLTGPRKESLNLKTGHQKLLKLKCKEKKSEKHFTKHPMAIRQFQKV